MSVAKTIEIISRHVGTVNLKVKGERRRITFEEKRDGIGVAKVDEDEAEVLLGHPNLKKDFWKEDAIEVAAEKTEKTEKTEKKEEKKPEKAADLIEKIQAAQTEEEVNTLLGDDKRVSVVSAADIRIEELKEKAGKQD